VPSQAPLPAASLVVAQPGVGSALQERPSAQTATISSGASRAVCWWFQQFSWLKQKAPPLC
jgi:hypothetical protein